jgi:hypothetical protein
VRAFEENPVDKPAYRHVPQPVESIALTHAASHTPEQQNGDLAQTHCSNERTSHPAVAFALQQRDVVGIGT